MAAPEDGLRSSVPDWMEVSCMEESACAGRVDRLTITPAG